MVLKTNRVFFNSEDVEGNKNLVKIGEMEKDIVRIWLTLPEVQEKVPESVRMQVRDALLYTGYDFWIEKTPTVVSVEEAIGLYRPGAVVRGPNQHEIMLLYAYGERKGVWKDDNSKYFPEVKAKPYRIKATSF